MNFSNIIASIKKHRLIYLIIISAIIYSYRIWDHNIIFSDELMIEDISYAMAHNHDFLIPMLNGSPFLVKPPLTYWMTAPLYYIFPPSPWVVRFWMPVFGILLTLVTYQLAKLWYGKSSAWWSALLLGMSTPLFFFTKTANYDLLNSLLITLSIYLYNLAKKNNKYLILLALSLSLGILNRSFLALLAPVVILADQILSANRIPATRLIASFALAFAIILPWHLSAYILSTYAFIQDYLLVPFRLHILETFPGHTPSNPFFYLIIVKWFPAILFLLLYKYWYTIKINKSAAIQLCAWIGILLLLSLARTHEEWYLTMFYPALAICVGCVIPDLLKKTKSGSITRQILIYLLIVIILEPPLNTLFFKQPQVDTVTAVNIMKQQSSGREPIYLWHYYLFPPTRFFPGRPVYRLKEKNIKEALSIHKIKFLIIRKDNYLSQRNMPPHKVLFQSNLLLLIRF